MIYILIGPIASGKSTFAKKKAKEGALIINDDSIVNALHANEYTLYNKDLKILYKQLEMVIITTGVALGRDIVIDRPCHSRSTRQRYTEIARSIDHPVTAVLFSDFGPEMHARRRSESDARGYDYEYWLRVAKEHQKMMQPLDAVAEGFNFVQKVDWYEGNG
jgi:predicted kinase